VRRRSSSHRGDRARAPGVSACGAPGRPDHRQGVAGALRSLPPGHPELERRIQLAEIRRTLDEGGGRSFQERRQTTLASLRTAGLAEPELRNYLLERRAPLRTADHGYIQHTVFTRNWGERLRDLLTADDWMKRSALCEAGSRDNVLLNPDYFCLYPITLFVARVPD
jgi:hypothetical protein